MESTLLDLFYVLIFPGFVFLAVYGTVLQWVDRKLCACMKKIFRSAGIPCADGRIVLSADETKEFAKKAGYPIIVKPDDGMGADMTYNLDSDEEVDMRSTPHITKRCTIIVPLNVKTARTVKSSSLSMITGRTR